MNKIETTKAVEKISGTKSLFMEKTNKTGKSVARFTRKNKRQNSDK